MNRIRLLIVILFVLTVSYGQEYERIEFENLNRSAGWQLCFDDGCTEDWQAKWFLDGLRAEIKNTDEGMVFSAGQVEGDGACHAVLWTKESFNGDVKIEYEYTRTDTRRSQVNILYIQASGVRPFAKDISEWNNLRIIPLMSTYFQNMELLHISYAAFDGNREYIRARRYPLVPGEDFSSTTEIPPASFETGLFLPGETYQITVIKTGENLYFYVEGKNVSRIFSWSLSENQSVFEGRIGLRHMYTRSARYKDFKIYTKI